MMIEQAEGGDEHLQDGAERTDLRGDNGEHREDAQQSDRIRTLGTNVLADEFRNRADVFFTDLSGEDNTRENGTNAYANGQIEARNTVSIAHAGAAER